MNRDAIVAVLHQTDIGFVANNLHKNWETLKSGRMSSMTRSQEISMWRKQNPAFNKNWIVLDDEYSGTGFSDKSKKSNS